MVNVRRCHLGRRELHKRLLQLVGGAHGRERVVHPLAISKQCRLAPAPEAERQRGRETERQRDRETERERECNEGKILGKPAS